jgi:hypothetical protein
MDHRTEEAWAAVARSWALALAAFLACACAGEPPARPPLEWLFIFHLPDDNDLDRHAERIEGEIRAGLSGDRVAATLLVDRAGGGGLRRVALAGGRLVSEEVLETDDSAAPAVLDDYLRWAVRTHPARRYALCLLGHGGRLDEVALDTGPPSEAGDGPRWASATAMGETIRRWRGSLGEGDLELLVLQQCGRATIEGLYSFRGAADVVVASETFVGAPNTYYRHVLGRLSSRPRMNAGEVALAILDTERDAAALAVLDGRALADLPREADALADALLPADGGRLARPERQLATYGSGGEVTYDLCTFAAELAERNGRGGDPAVERQLRWFGETLVTARRSRDLSFPGVDREWCGVSTFVPWRPDALRAYDALPFYRASRWRGLIERLEPPVVVPEDPEIVSVPPPTTRPR